MSHYLKKTPILSHRLLNGFQHQFLHQEIGFGIGVAAVGAEFLLESILLIGKGGVIIHIHDMVGLGVFF